MTENVFIAVAFIIPLVVGISTLCTFLVLRLWIQEAENHRALIRTAFIHMKAGSPAEAVQAESIAAAVEEEATEEAPPVARFTNSEGSEFLSSREGGTEYWTDPESGERFEVVT